MGGVPANSKGQLTKVTNGVSENRFVEFDLMGKVKTSQQITDGQTYECKYTYDSFGRLVSETYPSGRVVTNSFDSLGRLASVSSQVSETQTPRIYANGFGYNDKGQPDRMRLGNGLWESIKYNNQFQVTQLGLGKSEGDTSVLKLAYTYGVRDSQGNLDVTKDNGNVESQTITVPTVGQSQGFTATQVYEYDELNRLTQAKETSNNSTWWQQQFIYDRYGNRTVITGQNGTTESIVGPNPDIETSTNRIKPKANSSEQYQFDASGNMTRDAEGNRFTFDAENHQIKYFISTNNTDNADALYFYDSDGKRVKKVVGDEVTIFVYDGCGDLIAEYTINTEQTTNPQTVYTTLDTLSSPRINTNQNGQVVARHDYLPFGDEIIGLGQRIQYQEYVDDDIRQKFAGYEKDAETGLDFAQARYYGNGLGRFSSPDPAMESAKPSLPQSWNRYSYVMNNPVNLVDPLGLKPMWIYDDQEKVYFSIDDEDSWKYFEMGQKRYKRIEESEIGPNGINFVLTHGSILETRPELKDKRVFLSKSGNFVEWSDCLYCYDLGQEMGRYTPALQEAMEYMLKFDMLLIGGVTTLGPVGDMTLGLRSGTQVATNSYTAIGSTGKIGEDALKELGGAPQVYFRTSKGGRYVDQLVDGVANESKVGRVSLTKDVARQINKDAELIKTNQVKSVEWHFFRSPVTGKMGPSAPLMDALTNAGIKVVLH